MKGGYILDETGEKPVRCDELMRWAIWFENSPLRQVDKTFLGDEFAISTVFLGLDHGNPWLDDPPPPILWETIVFRIRNGEMDKVLECERCGGNREQAQAMHAEMVERMEALRMLSVGP